MASVKKDKKTGNWYVRVSYKDNSGKYRTKNKYGFKTKREAEIYSAQLEMKKLDNHDLSNDKDLTIFANYFEEWCYTYTIGKYSIGTDNKYKHEIELVKEYFKDTKLKDLTRVQYQSYINHRGTNRSKNTVEKTNGYLRKCLSYALADGLIKIDPSFGVILKYDKEENTKVKHLNKNEADKLLKYVVESDDFKDLMIYIALTTGLRIGEIYGLSYSDITKDTLSVNRGYNYRETNDFTSGKTKSSIRAIASTPQLYNKIKRHKLKQLKVNKKYLFLDHKNNPLITHTGLSKHFKNLLKELEIQELTLHALRHSHASLLLYAGLNIGYISKRLGHSNISETLKTYTHIINELEQTNDTLMQDLFIAK